MPLSIKQKQVLGVTTIVVLVVIGLVGAADRHARCASCSSRPPPRAEVVAASVDPPDERRRAQPRNRLSGHPIERRPCSPRSSRRCTRRRSSTPPSWIRPGPWWRPTIRPRSGGPCPGARTSRRWWSRSGYEQVRAVYTQGRTLEWRQPLALGDEPFGEISIGLSMVLIRNELIQSLRPAAIAVGLALVIAVSVAMLLAQVVLRPIHVITSGLTRLGRGELGKPLDLRDEEFRDLGDVFDQVSAQLQSAIGDGPKRAQLADLTRRVASLGRLTAGVAHEVKNPLNAMTIHLELLKQKLASPDPGAAARHAEVIGSEIRRLDDVVQGFLKFVRPEDVTLAPVKTRTLIASVLEAVVPEAERSGVELREQLPGPAAWPSKATRRCSGRRSSTWRRTPIQAMPRGGGCGSSAVPAGTAVSRSASRTPATASRPSTWRESSTSTSRRRNGAAVSACRWYSARSSCTMVTSTSSPRWGPARHSSSNFRGRDRIDLQCDCSPSPSWWHWPWADRRCAARAQVPIPEPELPVLESAAGSAPHRRHLRRARGAGSGRGARRRRADRAATSAAQASRPGACHPARSSTKARRRRRRRRRRR